MPRETTAERERILKESIRKLCARLARGPTPEEQAASDARWDATHRRIQEMAERQARGNQRFIDMSPFMRITG